MLDGLDMVPWGELRHAYGTAEDVPALLRLLASEDKEKREKALYELYGNIWHQGTIYEATSYAVPFLIELAVSKYVADRDQILLFLGSVAQGSSFLEHHQASLSMFGRALKGVDLEQASERETDWVESAIEAVASGIGVYAQLFDHPEPRIRMAVAYFVGMLGERARQWQFAVQQRLVVEKDMDVRSALVLSLGNIVPRTADGISVVERVLQGATDKLERTMAAMALVKVAEDQAPVAAIDVLVMSLANVGELRERYEQLPWGPSELGMDIMVSLESLGAEGAAYVASRLLPRIEDPGTYPSTDAYPTTWVAGALLQAMFGEPSDKKHRPEDLSVQVTKALQAITRCEMLWQDSRQMAWLLGLFKLPTSREELGELVADLHGQ